MMQAYDLYGFLSDDMDDAARRLEAALGIAFEARDSDFQGGAYFKWGKAGAENFILKRNADPYDDEAAEQDFPDHPVIFYVNGSSRSAELQHKLASAGCELLRHEDLA